MLIRFVEHTDILSCRQGGRIAKERFRNMFEVASPTNPIVFDFESVSTISSSFADEFFGKSILEMGFDLFKSKTTFKNLNPFVSNVIKNSIFHRNTKEFVNV